MFLDGAIGGRRLAHYVGALATVLLVTGCPGELEDPQRFDALGTEKASTQPACDTASVESRLLPQQCGRSGCHSAGGQSPDLASPGIAARLANKPAGIGVFLVPGSPDTSVLYTKATANPPYGSRMPIGAPLSDGDLACVRAWIEGLK